MGTIFHTVDCLNYLWRDEQINDRSLFMKNDLNYLSFLKKCVTIVSHVKNTYKRLCLDVDTDGIRTWFVWIVGRVL